MIGHRAKPAISVIIPTYNRAAFIGRAIGSVLAQTFQDWELIVVDDGSKDNTREIVEGFDDKRIRYLRQDQNRGPSAARNAGVLAAQAESIAFLDSDDEWLADKLERQLSERAKAPDGTWPTLCGYVKIHQGTGKPLSVTIPHVHGQLTKRYYVGILLGSVLLVQKEDFLRAGGFDNTLRSSEDWDLGIRLARMCQFTSVDAVLVKHYVHGDQLSADPSVKLKGYSQVRAKHGLGAHVSGEQHGAGAGTVAELGKLFCLTGNRRQGQRYLWKALVANPRNWRLSIHLLLSFFPTSFYPSVVGLWFRLRGLYRYGEH